MTLPEPRIQRYLRFLADTRRLRFDATTPAGYDALWRWSTSELPAFWASLWAFFEIASPTPYTTVLERETIPGARWFPGARLNYAQQVFRHADAAHASGQPAIVFRNEVMGAALQQLAWPELRRQVGALAAALRGLGVRPGDRVCAILPNTPQAVVAFLAAASLGAIWSVCSPDMGPLAILDRFRQIEPAVLIGCDGCTWGGVAQDRRAVLREVADALPGLRHLVLLRYLDAAADPADFAAPGRAAHDFDALTRGDAPLVPEALPFDHPLWVVYSSGTTGLPKPIVHGHGGIVLEALKMGVLHNDIAPSAECGERYHWFSTTGWIMWNAQVAGLLGGTTICLYDGNPGGAQGAPDWSTLWRFAADAGVTWFGAGAAFYASCLKAGVEPQGAGTLLLRAVGSTGSPLAPECYRWIWERLPQVEGRPIWLTPISGGTDFAGAFVAGLRTLPVVAGEMQCRCLGAAIEAWSEDGRPLVDEVGELVCTKPLPSMPLRFWNDPGDARYRESYFEMFPKVWRHGDWIRITPRGGAVIYGRSDATINRHGVRMGTAELYRAVEALPEVLDSLVVDLEYLGRESWMPLFVVLREGLVLDAALVQRLKDTIRQALSPRHVPSEVFQVAAIPRTLSGKKMELPVKKLLLGMPAEQLFRRDAMANAGCVDWFVDLAARRAAAQARA
ncbi:acetoacetate--CoA ligase [Piscinibacter defluvii]|uniref:acetoacetate--CoA ligase n=1 Tax=Piscinibacter defluvii TaxID=1796922 RepID=UPI000FDD5FA3|nr:acetoacetate--CoA ligase [Piscinibacter defluvii]